LALGIGTESPCPYYSCAAHLGAYVLDDGAIRVLIDPDELPSARHTCVHSAVADGEEWTPVAIAEQMRISLGLVELIQRHGVAKTGGLLARVRDERRAVYMDVAGIPDCRG
jgi:DNA helicase HerA-like ATPase